MAARPSSVLRGEFQHSLDEKNRLIVPQPLRPKGARELIVIRHPGAYLAVLTCEQFDELYEGLMQKYGAPRRQRDFGLVLNHMARVTPLDPQGRMSLSQAELTHAAIEREAIITGGSHRSQFEIWTPSRHEASVSEKLAAVGAMLEEDGV